MTLSWTNEGDSFYSSMYGNWRDNGNGGSSFENIPVILAKKFTDSDGNLYPAGTYNNGELNRKTLYELVK